MIEQVLPAVVVLSVALVVSIVATGRVLRFLVARQILDIPNDRSSHRTPTPRGGGWGVLAGLTAALTAIVIMGSGAPAHAWLLPGLILLVLVSWVDDVRTLPVGTRFVAQGAAVALGLLALPDFGENGTGLVFQGLLPAALDRAVTVIAWLWFINLYNFMDGIDGITGTHTASVGLGTVAVLLAAGMTGDPLLLALALVGSAIGFLVWNWHPARIFMGDVGSIPLGFLVGWLLLWLATQGLWVAALLVSGYYLADATWTLLRRMLKGERVWKAHREHFYQHATGKWSHDRIVIAILGLNVVLSVLAVSSVRLGPLVLPVGAACIVVLLGFFWHLGRKSRVSADLSLAHVTQPQQKP